jgi:hypothetical protein
VAKSKTVDELKQKHDPATIILNLRSELVQARAEAINSQVIREIIGTAKLETEKLQIPDWVVKPTITTDAPGVPGLMLSDLHWGERVKREQVNGVNEFNLTIARRRLKHTVTQTVKLCKILDHDMRYPGIVVKLGGDMVGGNIHEELAGTNEANIMPVVLDLYRELVAAIKLLADVFGYVFLPCVSGNHDRSTKKTWYKDRNDTSYGWLLYQFLADKFADDKRITFYIPDSADALYRMYNTRMLLTHGDNFPASDSIIGAIGPIMRGTQKKQQRNSGVGQTFDILECGHWHQRIVLSHLMVNSTLKGYDEFAAAHNYRVEPPSQNLCTIHPDIGVNWAMPVYCDKPVKSDATPWVSVPKL